MLQGIVVAIIGILAAIAIPNFTRFQARARQSEVNTHLKSLFTGLRTQQRKPPERIHATSFAPERGNRYTYLLGDCSSFENRNGLDPVRHDEDSCIGADHFKYPSFPEVFEHISVSSPSWNQKASANGMGAVPGTYGTTESWDFLAYGAGDVDNTPENDRADTWLIASADGQLGAVCPASDPPENVAAGEPFHVLNDVTCD